MVQQYCLFLPILLSNVVLLLPFLPQVTAQAPQFLQRNYTFALEEGVATGTIVGNIIASGPPNITYTIAHQEPSRSFNIDAISGTIILEDSIDADQRGVELTRTLACVATGSNNETATIVVTVQIIPVNDNAPQPQLAYDDVVHLNVAENSPLGLVIFIWQVSDQDKEDVISFTADSADTPFAISNATGEVFVSDPIDFEVKPQYLFALHATDGFFTIRQQLRVDIVDVNEPPKFVTSSSSLELRFSTPVGDPVFQAAAVDPDNSQTLSYSISSMEGGIEKPVDELHFGIDAELGNVFVARSLKQAIGTHILRIRVTDSAGASATSLLTIYVTSPPDIVLKHAQNGSIVIGTPNSIDDHVDMLVNGVKVEETLSLLTRTIEQQSKAIEEQNHHIEQQVSAMEKVQCSIVTKISTTDFSGDAFRSAEGIRASNGRIYAIPLNSTSVAVINPQTSMITTMPIHTEDVIPPLLYSWGGGVLSRNKHIIFGIPLQNEHVLVIDTLRDVTAMVIVNDPIALTPNANNYRWAGGVLGDDDRVYGVPYDARAILVVDPFNSTFSLTPADALLPIEAEKWVWGVKARNGNVYCIPHSSTAILMFSTNTNSTDADVQDTVDFTSLTTTVGTKKWQGGVLGVNGKVYGIPHFHTHVLVIDPTVHTVDFTTIRTTSSDGKWRGGVLSPHGRIIGIPYNSQHLLIVDTASNTTDFTSYQIPVGMDSSPKWSNGVMVGNSLFGMPSYDKESNKILHAKFLC
eukprot:m.80349 g.80349  ORF g.80349 m.80349 type:complete len:748 (-) comp12015_c0_seq2:137-2380(-)